MLLRQLSVQGSNAYECMASLHKKHGSHFNVEWQSVSYPIKLYKYKQEWRIHYRQKKQYTKYIPFSLFVTSSEKTVLHIGTIHRETPHSGSSLVRFVLALGKVLKAKKAELQDVAHVQCKDNNQDMRLSLLLFLKKGKGFYEQFGCQSMFQHASRQTKMLKLRTKLQRIKLETVMRSFRQTIIVLQKAIKKPDQFELIVPSNNGYPTRYTRDPERLIPSLLHVHDHTCKNESE